MMEDRYQRVFPKGILIFSHLNLLKRSTITIIWTMIVVTERNMSTPFAIVMPAASSPYSKLIIKVLPPLAENKIPTAKIYVIIRLIIIAIIINMCKTVININNW